jgi:hypothetical protein
MQYKWILYHSLLDFLSADIKRKIPSAGYMANLAPKLNQFIVKDYFYKLKELATNAIMDKPERIYITEEKGCRLSFVLFLTKICHFILN